MPIICFKYLSQLFLSIALLASLWACTNANTINSPNAVAVENNEKNVETPSPKLPDSSFRYNLDEPNSKFKLSKKLKEISGLTCYQDKWLMAVQDERGAMYVIDVESGETKEIIDFSADGDYEGIACKDDVFYALRADGVLFRILNWDNKKKIKTKVIDTNLGEINDTEGLAFDPEENRLIIACKGSPVIGEVKQKSRAIYAYDLKKNKFLTEPICILTRKAFKAFIKENIDKDKDYKDYKKDIKKATKSIIIEPSGIAVHPISKEYYILSAASNTLLVLDRKNNIKQVKHLSKKQFEQVEGITFNSKGDLFISTEGNEKKAKIYKFDYVPY